MFKAKKRGAADSVESDEEDYEERDDEDAHSTSSRDDSDPDTDADSSVDSDSETEARGSGGKTRKTRARVEELEDEDETSGDFAFEAYYSPESRAAMEEAIKRNEERIQGKLSSSNLLASKFGLECELTVCRNPGCRLSVFPANDCVRSLWLYGCLAGRDHRPVPSPSAALLPPCR